MAPYYEKKMRNSHFLIRLFRNITVGQPREVKYLFFKLEKAKIIKDGMHRRIVEILRSKLCKISFQRKTAATNEEFKYFTKIIENSQILLILVCHYFLV